MTVRFSQPSSSTRMIYSSRKVLLQAWKHHWHLVNWSFRVAVLSCVEWAPLDVHVYSFNVPPWHTISTFLSSLLCSSQLNFLLHSTSLPALLAPSSLQWSEKVHTAELKIADNVWKFRLIYDAGSMHASFLIRLIKKAVTSLPDPAKFEYHFHSQCSQWNVEVIFHIFLTFYCILFIL